MATIILDNFVGADNERLAAHTIAPTNTAGASWNENTGVWAIHHPPDDAYAFAASTNTPCTLDAGVSDCTITCSLILGSTASDCFAGLAFRATDKDNTWYAFIRGDTNKLEIYNRVGGVNGLAVDSQSYTVPTSTTVTMTVTLSGTSISVTVGATTAGTTSSTRQTATIYGLASAEGSDKTKWDDFQLDGSAAPGGGIIPLASYYDLLLRPQ